MIERPLAGSAGDTLSPRSDRLRVLFVAKRFPYPADTGGKIRTARLLEQLSRRLDITLISNVEHPKDDPYLSEVHELCARFEPVPWLETARGSLGFYARVLRRLGSRYPVSVVGDHSRPFAERIRTCLARDRYDLLVCDFVQPSINIDDQVEVPVLLFQHNVESMIFERHARTAASAPLRWFWRSQWRKMERFEHEACRRFAGVVAVSEADRGVFAEGFGARRTFAIPTAVDADYFRPSASPVVDGNLVFTGSMDWLPNEDAVLFFADEILPRVIAHAPGATLTVVGRSPSPRLRRRLAGRSEVTITGRVDDIRPHMQRAAVYVIPLRIGGGTRIKAYEAMAMAKPVVSTPIGVEGLPVRDGEHLVLAESAEDFATAVVGLLQQPDRRHRLGQAARRFVEGSCSWPTAAVAFVDACCAVVAAGAHQAALPLGLRAYEPRSSMVGRHEEVARPGVSGMARANRTGHEPFYHYYAEASQTPKTLQRFRSIRDCVMRVLEENGETRQALEVADIGCGAGTQCLVWAEMGHRVHGLDVNEPLLELARKRATEAGYAIEVQVGSAVRLPWPDESMDVCLVIELLEHVADWEPCLSECQRVLKPGGVLFLTTSNKLCPIQQEFDLPMYSWYPGWLKRRFERLSVTTRPELVNFAEFPAVNWFSFYSLRAALTSRGFGCRDRFDMMDLSTKGQWAKIIVSLIRSVGILRWCAHVAAQGTTIAAVKRAGTRL